jgi:nucleotide-binding universal stress UspA family protein
VIKPSNPIPTTIGMVPGMDATSAQVAAQVALENDKWYAARSKRYLSGKARAIRSQYIKASYHVVIGEPAPSIISFATKEHIDLLVMTTHGKGGLKRAIMGSVADTVIRESGKPVLVVRPKANIEENIRKNKHRAEEIVQEVKDKGSRIAWEESVK